MGLWGQIHSVEPGGMVTRGDASEILRNFFGSMITGGKRQERLCELPPSVLAPL